MKNWLHILPFKFFFLFLFLLTIVRITLYYSFPTKSFYSENTTELVGQIKTLQIDGNLMTMKIHGLEDIIGFYYFKTEEEKSFYEREFMEGMKIRVTGVFDKPQKETIPNTFNYQNYLKTQKISYTVTISEIKQLKKASFLYQIKNKISHHLDNMPYQNYYEAFIFGESNDLDKDRLSQNGLSHLFAISGMHISFLLFLLELFLPKNKLSFTSIFFILIFYSFLAHFPISILRALGMYYLTYFDKKYHLGLQRRSTLLLLCLFFLIYNPYLLESVSFLFSFYLSFCLSFLKPSKNYFLSLVKSSLVAMLASLPILGCYFYQINLLSFIFNLLMIPFVSFLLFPLCLITFLFPALSFLFAFFIQIFDKMNVFFSQFTFAIISLPKLCSVYYIFLAFLIGFFLASKKRKKELFVILILSFIGLKIIPYLDSSLSVYYLDVKQGDASLIVFPYKKEVILIDTGGQVSFSNASWKKKEKSYLASNLATFIHSLGIDEITTLILTHGDYDHMGEAINLVNNFKVEKVIFNCGPYNDLEKELIKVLDEKKIKYYSCIKELNIDNNKLYFLQTKEYDNENDNSNVIYTDLNGYKFMFMGDAGIEKEKDIILDKYNISDIDVLKVGHHGSKTSSSKGFINVINPKYSIISVGKNNRYGHPNKEVLENLENSKIYRTDLDGSIMFKIKNNKLKIEICSP